jgi:hypothetical protein
MTPDVPEGFCGIHTGNRNTHQIGTSVSDPPNLGNGRLHITCLSVRHTLNSNGRITTNGNPPTLICLLIRRFIGDGWLMTLALR